MRKGHHMATHRPPQDQSDLLNEDAEEQAVEEAAMLSSKLVYEVIRRDGREELNRTNRALFWSGTSAGIFISFSVIAEAVLRTYLPQADWTFLVENLGYTFGFLIVIHGRMQLFTENTITTVLPLMVDPSPAMFAAVARLWGLVLFANVIGAFVAATFLAYGGGVPDNLIPALTDLSRHATGMGPGISFARAIPAGLLLAAIVWMIPQLESGHVLVVIMFTWLIAAGDFTHVVAGSVEMAFLLVRNELGLFDAIFGFFLPVFAGNVIGGTAVFSMMIWGQVRDDMQQN
jgi:formate/nitrite transporter FocA (FNT family)